MFRTSRVTLDSDFTLELPTPMGFASFPATIPGSIHTDLMAAGVIGDIRTNGNEIEQEWIRNADSSYRTSFEITNSMSHHELNFLGLDTFATVLVNGEIRLVTENMHRSYQLDLGTPSTNVIDLRIDFKAPLPEAFKRESELGVFPNPYNMPYNFVRKMACSFGWDWGPTTITSGIWRPIILTSWDVGILDSVLLVTDVVASIPRLKVTTIGRGSAQRISIAIGIDGAVDFSTTLNSTDTFDLPGANLWYPRGFGDPTLYPVIISLHAENGEIVDQVTKRVGFRSISLDQSSFGERQMFAVQVNGERVWAKGVNWIPDDPFPHRVSLQEYAKKIEDLFSLEVNAIRVWGGGIYESDILYDLCDEKGIIVWQDFLFACAAYPENQSFIEEITHEASEAVIRLSHHASLVLWCGGNECIEGFQHWDWKNRLEGKSWGAYYYFNLLPKILNEIDGSRAYIPGSPFSTVCEDVKDFASGTNHIWDVWNERGYQRYEEYSPSFAAEFGYNGPASWSTLTKAINRTTLDSADIKLVAHQKAFSGMEKIAAGLRREFQPEFTSGASWYFAAQLVQARAVEIGLKHFRSQYNTCSGSILWQYNDMWPAISWSVLDSSGARKLSWYAMREAYRPRFLHFSGTERSLVIVNDSPETWRDQLDVVFLDEMGSITERTIVDIEVASRDKIAIESTALFSTPHILASNGYLVASLGDIRVARRTLDQPVQRINAFQGDINATTSGTTVHVHLKAHAYIHEFSLLPELVAHNLTRVASQRVAILPEEVVNLEIIATDEKDAKLIQASINEISWSLNRLVAPAKLVKQGKGQKWQL